MTGLFLNFYECNLSVEHFDISYLMYDDYSTKELYKNLQSNYSDYEFYRYDITTETGDTERRIYFWSRIPNPLLVLEGHEDRVYIQKNPKITSRIIESCVVQHFKNFQNSKGQKFEVYKKKENHFWSIISPSELMPNIEGLSVRNEFHFSSFFFYHNEKLHYGFLISPSIKLKFTIDKKEFENRNIACSDLKGTDEVIFANKQSLKRFLFATGQQSNYDINYQKISSNQNSFNAINKVFAWLQGTKEKVLLPNSNNFKDFSIKYLPLENDKIQPDKLEEPTRYYFENRTGRGYYHDLMTQLKPYSFGNFKDKIIKIVILCPKFHEGSIEGFINSLENLLKTIFHINPHFVTVTLKDAKPETYDEAIYDNEINDSSLVIVILNEDHIKLPIKQSPYYICKAKLIGQGIPTQDVQVKHIQKTNPFVMKNLALNIYAKIGGTGWTIEKLERRKEELVVGIGSSMNKEGKLVLGIAQIFHSDGRYLVGDCSPLSTFDNYAENLEKHLFNSLSKVIDKTINKKVEFRLIFHLFKSASSQYEIKAVENIIKKFQTENLTFKYSFVHLAYGHNFRLFNDDGKAQITKGTYIELTKSRSLVHFVAESITPLEVEIDRRSTFSDLRYISKQVYWFSNLSHRTFLPSKKTVTILYPSIMSGLMEKLREIEDWDKKKPEKITEKLWFI
jgi:hypothetical protein